MAHHLRLTTHVTGKRRDVEFVVYDQTADMRRSATRWSHAVTPGADPFNEAMGVCHGFQRISIGADGSEKDDPLVAIVRLTREALTPLVVSHEVAHAAQHIYGMDYSDDKPISEHMHSGNEDFAHLYGEIFGNIWPLLEPASLNKSKPEGAEL